MSTEGMTGQKPAMSGGLSTRKLPQEASILLVLIGMALVFEVLGWMRVDQSFLANSTRLSVMLLQVSVIGILAVGVTQVIITGGVDLSSGSVVGMSAIVAASFAQTAGFERAVFPALTGMPVIVPVVMGLLMGAAAGLINGALIANTGIPPFIATLGMMVTARGFTKWYTNGQPVSNFIPDYNLIGGNTTILGFTVSWPIVIFLTLALIFHIALRYTRYGKFTYAIGSNVQAARVSGINVGNHLIKVYAIAGALSGIAGIVGSARVQTAQAGFGVSYELDAIAAAVIGGTSLAGGVGRITGTVIGAIILSVMSSGFTFLGVNANYQEMIKGAVIVAAVVADQYRQRKRKKV